MGSTTRGVLTVSTSRREDLVDITDAIAREISHQKWTEGVLLVYVPHTSCGITINENADPNVGRDISSHLTKLVPARGNYQHIEENADSHIKAALVGTSVTVILEGGRMMLGRWQGILLCEFDGPRERTVTMKFLAG